MGGLGACYRLDVDTAASAAVSVLSSPKRSSVESGFELLAVLLLPLVHRDTVLLLYPVSVPFGYDVERAEGDRKSTRLNSSHVAISYAVFCLKKKKQSYYITNDDKNNETITTHQEIKHITHHLH